MKIVAGFVAIGIILGVSAVAVRYPEKKLVVDYDDAKTSSAEIMKDTASVGFPSTVAK